MTPRNSMTSDQSRIRQGVQSIWQRLCQQPSWTQVTVWIFLFPIVGAIALAATGANVSWARIIPTPAVSGKHEGRPIHHRSRPRSSFRVFVTALAAFLVFSACSEEQHAGSDRITSAADSDPDAETALQDNKTSGDGSEDAAVSSDTNASVVDAALASASLAGGMSAHFIDAGQADATLLLHDSAVILIDTGHWQRADVVQYLRSQVVTVIDLVVITHPHADHVGQFDKLIDAFDVREVWWSGATSSSATFARALAALERSGAAYEEPRAGDQASIGSFAIDVVNPSRNTSLSDLHDSSLAIRVTYGATSFLFTGDAETTAERRMTQQSPNRINVDVLQLGHHGSQTPTLSDFLRAVNPSIAIYSAGQNNQYGHPHTVVTERLKSAGVEVFGTDIHGHIIVNSDGRKLTVNTQRAGPASQSAPTPALAQSGCVDINSAGFEELQRIIHIEPGQAQAIPPLRPFSSVNQMDRISGIGPVRLRDILNEGIACAL